MTSPWRSGSRCTAPTHGSCTSGRRPGVASLFAEEGVRHPLGYENLHDLDGVADAVVSMRQHGVDRVEGHRQTQRGRLRSRQCAGRPARPAASRRREGARARSSTRLRQHASSSARTPPLDDYLSKLAERGGIVEELISGRRDSQSKRAATRDADRRGRVAVHPRPGARRAERTELPRLPIPGRLQLRPGDQRRSERSSVPVSLGRVSSVASPSTSSRCATPTADGRRTRSSSISARAARHIRSSRCSSSPAVATTHEPASS